MPGTPVAPASPVMRRRPASVLATVALLAAGATGACGWHRPPAAQPLPAPPAIGGAENANPTGLVPDDVIVGTTQRELASNPWTAGERVGVDSAGGVLTLQGPVTNRLAKRRAVDVAHVVRGVRAIVDRTEVSALPRPDYELDSAVGKALSRDPVTAGLRVGVRTQEGVVLLSGHVGSSAARYAAESDAMAVPGVIDAVDSLSVVPAKRSDARIAAEVDRVVTDDPWLGASHIHVAVHDGVATLEGWVASAAERARATGDAWAASPVGVDAAALRVDQFTDDGTLRATPRTARTDGDLKQALLDALVRDPRVHPFAPTVEVLDGVVVLTGVAPNRHVARALDDDARALPGAGSVEDNVRTLPHVYQQDDTSIRDEVARAVARDPGLRASVRVDVVGGRVFLRGTVASNADRLRAVAIAASPPGARDVEDGLVVAPRGAAATMQAP